MFIEIDDKIINSSFIYRIDRIKKDENMVFLQTTKGVECHRIDDSTYEKVRKMLLNEEKDNLSDQVESLTSVIRDLWNLLRARLH